VARGAAPERLYAAVNEEIGRLVGADGTIAVMSPPGEGTTIVVELPVARGG
jgi:chemotaxis protein histidine kinase CheA